MKKLLITTTALVALCAHAKAETLNVLEEGVLVSHGKGFEVVHGVTQVQAGDLVKVQKAGKAELVSKDGKTVSLNQGVTRVSNNLFLDPSQWTAQFGNATPTGSANMVPAQSAGAGPVAGPPPVGAGAGAPVSIAGITMSPVVAFGALGAIAAAGVVGGLAASGNLGNSSSNNSSNNDAAVLAIAASQNKVSR